MKGVVSRKPRVLARCPIRKAANAATEKLNAELDPRLRFPMLPSDTPPSRSAVRLHNTTSDIAVEFFRRAQAAAEELPS